jgi:CCR4-NOT complex subunit CAF16
MTPPPPISITGLDFTYPGADRPVLRGLDLAVPAGARCLLVGANGAGKTTLLTLVAGKHMVADRAVRVLGRPAFTDTSLALRVAFLGGAFPFDVDVGVDEILARQQDVDGARRDHLLSVLGVDPRWRMSRVSDGQRRRVQILLGLLHPAEVLLLDEVTTDLDVIARSDLLAFLRRESEERGATILYASHILDALDRWATHLAWLDGGAMRVMCRIEEVSELVALRQDGVGSPLLRLVERWLRAAAAR